MNLSEVSSTSKSTLETDFRTVPSLRRSFDQKLHFSHHRRKGKEKKIENPDSSYFRDDLF